MPANTSVEKSVDDHWETAFVGRRDRHQDVSVRGATVARDTLEVFGPSIATFQLGESGTGAHLLSAARRAAAPHSYVHALELFVREEQEHARLLALVLDEFEWPRRQSHWSDRVFVVIRRLHSLRTEVLTLLVAELIALTYYSSLRDRIGDPQLREVFRRIHEDEVVHVDFHGATLPKYLVRFPRPVRALVRLLWNALVIGASVIVAVDHGRLLRRLGLGRTTFFRQIQRDRRALDTRLFGRRERDA